MAHLGAGAHLDAPGLRTIFEYFMNFSNITIFYGIFMEEYTCEARLPHINGNVVRT